ncbi:GNAT family N-acetyltransferase [Olivibacter domesticus]|uniref:Ribosomal protein S18 acetylase RimI n=1 Tax=Olivibacter domesticus TaxID=407022 RepID=A0A1H7W412_OLID1|nr:GNAT family N-acetyltransferase [Olivibacter domesticus]SEM15718.1 Ribosomal protein S18 acetylase RimI [Olivibacter domesticus]
MNQITIRTATLEDIEVLLTFEQGVIAAERPLTTSLKDTPINYYDVKAFIVDPDVEIVVAVIDGKLIGSGYIRIMNAKNHFRNRKFGYLGFMYVLADYRGMGVNKKIMDVLIHWGTEQGLTEFKLNVYQENETAIRAYEKIGFKKHMIEMRMDLTERQS